MSDKKKLGKKASVPHFKYMQLPSKELEMVKKSVEKWGATTK